MEEYMLRHKVPVGRNGRLVARTKRRVEWALLANKFKSCKARNAFWTALSVTVLADQSQPYKKPEVISGPGRKFRKTVNRSRTAAHPPPFDHSTFTFVDMLPWPAMLLDDSGRIHHLNPLLDTHETVRQAAIGGDFATHFPEYRSALSGSHPWLEQQAATVLRTLPDGEQRFEQLTLRRLPKGACLIIVDQTEHWKLETSNTQTIRLASLGFMLASVSHEIGNPLTAIHSMVQILQSKKDTRSSALKEGLQNIATSVRRLLTITRKLTVFSRADQEPQVHFRIDSAVEEAILLFSFDSLGETVQVTYDKEPAAIVHGLPGQLQQVVFNILLNAAQAMNGHGTISIKTRLLDEKSIDVEIHDTGPGIPAERLQEIFEPFFTTKPSGEGTGLGLALSNEIAHEHGGHIWAENHPRGGACFHIHLPRSPQP
jgi:two-component system NtrC family sensor kinase